MMLLKQTFKKQGFSVVELSFLITVITMVIIGYLASTTNSNINYAQKIKITKDKMVVIEEAILKFKNTRNRYPCPAKADSANGQIATYSTSGITTKGLYDDEYLVNQHYTVSGISGAISTSMGNACQSPYGNVPTRALGIDSSYMLDGWGNRFLYTEPVCGSNASSMSCNSKASSFVTTLNVSSSNFAVASFDGAYLLVSYGPNGNGARTISGAARSTATNSDELENNDSDASYVAKTMQNGFDDIVYYKTKKQVEAMRLNPITPPISLNACINNSLTLKSIKHDNTITNANYNSSGSRLNTVKNIRESLIFLEKKTANVTTYCDASRIGTFGCADEAILDILWSLQDACFLLYPSTLPAALTGGIKQCPGGGTYDSTTDSCYCTNGTWSGDCSSCGLGIDKGNC
jgi:hypothetical protein